MRRNGKVGPGWRTRTARPPGPPARVVVGHTLQFARDPLGFPRYCTRTYGGLVFLRLRGLNVYLVTDPSLLEDVLVARRHHFTIDRLSRRLADALGESLLISDGPFWEQQRHLVQPAFARDRLGAYADAVSDAAVREVNSWSHAEAINLLPRLSALSVDAIGGTVLGGIQLARPEDVVASLEVLMQHVLGFRETGVRPPAWLPTPGNRRARRALVRINQSLRYAVDQADSLDPDGVVALLEAARRKGMPGVDEKQVQDELVTMLLVGHDTTSLALTFACWLLARHVEVQDEAAAEVEGVLDGRNPELRDLPRLPLLDAVARETLRLYPPVWAFGREAHEPVELGGYPIDAGAQILVSPWVNHRSDDWFPGPDEFRPGRWLDGETDGVPRLAWLPFGAGPRHCLGSRLAMVELVVVLAVILQRWQLDASEAGDLLLKATATLRPKVPVRLHVTRRGGPVQRDGPVTKSEVP